MRRGHVPDERSKFGALWAALVHDRDPLRRDEYGRF